MRERIEEQFSGMFSTEVPGGENPNFSTIVDMRSVTNKLKAKVTGSYDHIFNVEIESLKASYLLPSLANKPFIDYALDDSEEAKHAKNIEFGFKYNERTKDSESRYYAVKLEFGIEVNNSVLHKAGIVLLYNNNVMLHIPLMPYLSSSIIGPEDRLNVRAINKDSYDDSLYVTGTYRGTMSYTFEKGPLVISSGTFNVSHLFL